MCNFFKIYPSPRINRRKRRYFAVLSLTSGLTMLVMLHHTSVISPSDTHVIPYISTTNDTPVDYFVATEVNPMHWTNEEDAIVYPSRNENSKLLRKVLKSQPRFHTHNSSDMRKIKSVDRNWLFPEQTVGETISPKDVWTTENVPKCCQEDFHQNPYEETTTLVPRVKPKQKHVNFFLSTVSKRSLELPKSRKWSNYYSKHGQNLLNQSKLVKIKIKERNVGSKRSKIKKLYLQKSNIKKVKLDHHSKWKTNVAELLLKERNKLKFGEDATLRNMLETDQLPNPDRKFIGNTIINIKIGKLINNPPLPILIKNTTPSSEIKAFYSQYLEEPNKSPIPEERNMSVPVIDIPELTLSNVSFASLKQQKLKEIFEKIDIKKIFSNNSYRDLILSRDLSQWSDLLSLPEDNVENTYEPNQVLENYDYGTGRPGSTDTTDGERLVAKSHPSGDSLNIRIKNNLPNELLREIPRQRIRKSFRIRSREENSFLLQEEKNMASELLQINNVAPKQFPEQPRTTEYRNVLYPFHLDYTRQAYFPWRTTKDECSSHATRFLVGGTGKIVPLVSFPGSGNTWLRYISETLTGVFSGSLYEDDILAIRGFWGERDSYIEGTTLTQKTHSFPALPNEVKEWDGRMILGPAPRKVLLLIRSPYEALVSLRHFHAAGHTGFGHHSAFSGVGWDNFTEMRSDLWLRLNKAWLELPDSKVLVIHYEMLLQNIENEAKRLLRFYGVPLDYGRLSCLQRYPEGKFRRPRYPKHLQGYQISKRTASLLASAITSLNQILAYNGHPTLPTQLYSYHPPTKASLQTDSENKSIN